MTLAELYELFDLLRPHRRGAAAALLEHRFDTGEARKRLATAHAILESLPGDGALRELSVDGRGIRVNLDYEFRELERDVICLDEGMHGVLRSMQVSGSFDEQVSALEAELSGRRYAAVFTDRDGTIANYCGRYRSSHQPIYAAVHISRFARSCADDFFVVTSGPLYGNGLLSLSAFPEETVHLAGSKGREYLLANGETGSFPLTNQQRAAVIHLDEMIRGLLDRPEYRILAMIGSGYQRKFGQLTVSRQDIHRSVPVEVSDAFLHDVRRAVEHLGSERSLFEIDDTGFDIELTLTAEGNQARGFDKGDGVRFLADTVALRPGDAPILVCGDTESDVSMLESLAAEGYETQAVFVAVDGELERRVRRIATRSAFCSGPDVLVTAMGIVGEAGGRV